MGTNRTGTPEGAGTESIHKVADNDKSESNTATPRLRDSAAVDATLTKTERTELTSIAKMNGRLAREGVALRQAELLADFEAQLAAIYGSNADAWSEVTQEANRLVAEADAVVAARCEEMGIRPEFRPKLVLNWYGRGVNADAKRRAELRKVAVTRLDAMAKAAKYEISQQETAARTAIAATALTSTDAARWLNNLPTAEALMPALKVAEIEQITGAAS